MSRKTATQTRSQRTEVVTDTLHEVVWVTVRDTVWEKTMETVLVNDTGDTLRRNVVTDRLIVRDRDRVHQRTERSSLVNDSVAVDTKEQETVAVVGADRNVEIDSDGNLTLKDTPIRSTLKWLVALLIAATALLLTIKRK